MKRGEVSVCFPECMEKENVQNFEWQGKMCGTRICVTFLNIHNYSL